MDVSKSQLAKAVSRRGFLGAGGAAAALAITGCKSGNMGGRSMGAVGSMGRRTSRMPPKEPDSRMMRAGGLTIRRRLFGFAPGGIRVDAYTVSNSRGGMVEFITYGARVAQLHMPDRHGHSGDICLGYDHLKPYLNKDDPYFGATIGRVANRIGHARFNVDGKTYHISVNDNKINTLHGGLNAFDRQVWDAYVLHTHRGLGVRFKLFSPAMQNGFPGNLHVTADYVLTENNEILADLYAVTDQATPVNLTNHTYFNLRGPGHTIDHQLMTIYADYYTPVDKLLVPNGKLLPVAGTVLDFRHATMIGKNIMKVPSPSNDRGYDHNYVIRHGGHGNVVKCAKAEDPHSGRVMEVYTNQPGVQFYTGNFLNGTLHGIGGKYPYHGAFTLEPQDYPDAVNRPNFPSCILHPGQRYHEIIRYRFSTTGRVHGANS